MRARATDAQRAEEAAVSGPLGAKGQAAEVQRAKQGDASVWEAWFQTYYPSLFRYAYIRLRRRAEAEEIASQVFVEAYRGIERYTYTGKPGLAWLYRIAHNLVYDRLRAEERRAALVAEGPATKATIDGPEASIPNMDLLKALDSLTDEQREVVILRFYLGMSAQEVSPIVGKSPAAVFSLQARALVALRSKLGDEVSL
jgi:RNA polymerase sigma-70 factor (ECF subfamily)